jgi:hypothetical protein
VIETGISKNTAFNLTDSSILAELWLMDSL